VSRVISCRRHFSKNYGNSEKTFAEFPSFVFKAMFNELGGNSQNFLGKFVRFFVTLGLEILRLFMLKVLFKATIIQG
jgi:hypothetical protein